MKLHVAAIGKLKPGPERELAEHYFSRAGQMMSQVGISALTVTEHVESQAKTAELRKTDEAARLLGACPASSVIIAMDESGKDLSSQGLADVIAKRLETGASDLAFLIGGPDGHSSAVQARASMLVSMGRMTWPHRLARIMLAEQIYRSVTILLNHPYHRS